MSEPSLHLADRLAETLVAAATPVTFRLATSEAERQAVYRLRCATVVAEGWATAEQFPDGMERDARDDEALHVCGWHGHELAACARLVLPRSDRPLPTEEAFSVGTQPHGRVVDVGRGIVAPAYRDADRRVFVALLARCWLELRQRGFTWMCGDAADWLVATYRRMGFAVRVLGPPRRFWGEERRPILVDPVASLRPVASHFTPRRAAP